MPAGVSAWTPLANLTLGSSQATVTFSSISGSYRDLVLVIGNIITSGNVNMVLVNFNSDTGSNYNYVTLYGNGSSVNFESANNQTAARPLNNIAPNSSSPSQILMQLLDYSATDKHKTIISRVDAPSTNFAGAGLSLNRWANTAAITQIAISQQSAATFSAGTTFALYGVSS